MDPNTTVPHPEVLSIRPSKPSFDRSFTPEGEPSDAVEVDRREHATNIERLQRTLGLGALLGALLGVVDVLTVHMHKYPALAPVWAARAALIALALGVRARLGQKPAVTPGWLRTADLAVFGWATATVTLLAVQSGGFASPDVHGILLILLAQVLSVPAERSRTAVRLGLTIVVFLATMGTAAALSPAMAAQLADPTIALAFGESMAGTLAAAVLLVELGHSHWQARRQVMATRTVGRYVLQRRIGCGGMGDVWRAYHPALRRDVAIKIMRPDRVTPALTARFEREISMMTELSHPNTVRVFDCGTTDDGLLYCVMELCAGRTLRELVSHEGPLRPDRAVHIARQVARALAEAHGRRIVHRDIKPDNIVITSAGGERDFVKVLDFGIAKLERMEEGADLTEPHFVVGTPAYMSPEQAEGHLVGPQSDLYSLGAVLFFALTGRSPFQGTVARILQAHREEPAPPVASFARDSVPPALGAVIQRCLDKDPRRRFASAAELDAALAAVPLAPAAAPAPRAGRGVPRDDTPSRIRSVYPAGPGAAASSRRDGSATVHLKRRRDPER